MEFEKIKNKFSIKEKKILKSFNTFHNKFNSCQGGNFYLWGYDIDISYFKYFNETFKKKIKNI